MCRCIVCATWSAVQCLALSSASKTASSRLSSLTSKLPSLRPSAASLPSDSTARPLELLEARADTHNRTLTQLPGGAGVEPCPCADVCADVACRRIRAWANEYAGLERSEATREASCYANCQWAFPCCVALALLRSILRRTATDGLPSQEKNGK